MSSFEDDYFKRVLSGIVHGIRNPLHGINVSTAALSSIVENLPDARIFLQMIMNEVSRLSYLMDRVQELREKVSLDTTTHPLARVIGDALKQEQDLVKDRGSSVLLQDKATDVLIRCDGHRLCRAFAALIENAVESGQGVQVEIVISRMGDKELQVTISDNGKGIRAADLPHVLEPFFTTRAGKFGLGATIAESIIASHGGRILVSSEESKGTRIEVILPMNV